MLEQLSLLDSPMARTTDPISSHLAADEVKQSGARAKQARAVLVGLRKYPGLTSRELSLAMGADRVMVARRLPDLADAGEVERGEMRKCQIVGRLAQTWWPL